MGVIADVRALKCISVIKSGRTSKLSLSQITGLITNMSDAKKNLSLEDFNIIYDLFKEMRTCNTKIEMDMAGYLETSRKIIMKFDKIAPYEKYSGGNEIEISFMMDDIRNMETPIDDIQSIMENLQNEEEKEYIRIMVDRSNGIINIQDATNFMGILKCYQKYGKNKALKEFDNLANKYIHEIGGAIVMGKISFMAGMLYPNGIVSKNESDELSKKYLNHMTNELFNNHVYNQSYIMKCPECGMKICNENKPCPECNYPIEQLLKINPKNKSKDEPDLMAGRKYEHWIQAKLEREKHE